jgi:hypothetical protein
MVDGGPGSTTSKGENKGEDKLANDSSLSPTIFQTGFQRAQSDSLLRQNVFKAPVEGIFQRPWP